MTPLNPISQKIGSGRLLKSRGAIQGATSEPSPAAAADEYRPASGIKTGRFFGKTKRVLLHGAAWVATAGFLVGAAASAAVPGLGALLLMGAAATAGGAWLTKKPVHKVLTQNQSLGDTYRSALQGSTTSEQRSQSFNTLEKAIADPSVTLSSNDGYNPMAGTRKAAVRTLSGGGTVLWKTGESGQILRDAVPRYGENGREVAAYLVDKRLGHFARVPPSVDREFEGKRGVATLIVDQAVPGKADEGVSWLLARPEIDGYRKVAIFDNIIGNLDRHQNNFLISEEGRVVPIDHGLSFPTKNGEHRIRPNYSFDKTIALNKAEKAMLSGFLKEREEVAAELSGHLEPEAIAAMFARVEKMLECGHTNADWRARSEKSPAKDS